MNSRIIVLLATASVAAFGHASAGMAQDAAAATPPGSALDQTQTNPDLQPDMSGDVIVTAQKRAERVQDVPLSISVASQEQLERQ